MKDAIRAGEVEIRIGGERHPFPLLEGTEGEKAVDISDLRQRTGLVALDYGFRNTAACKSEITYLNGEEGILRYRGYDVARIAPVSRFIEVAYLLVHGCLPNAHETETFSSL